VHYQISAEAVQKLRVVLEEVLARKGQEMKVVNGTKETPVGEKTYGT
jgi:hypothetical protein